MALRVPFSFVLLILFGFFFSSQLCAAKAPSKISIPFNRTSFPPNFIFGAASAAYQYEGAAFEDGKGLSIWDVFAHKHPEKILDHSNGDVADDFYHRYKEDVKLMKFEGLNGFRFSISWSRVLPYGKLSKGVNKLGIAFYNNLINELISNGITPLVTLFHWDTPQALEDDYLGFLNSSIVNDFRDFAELCFKEFGDRVKYWTTFNEPWSFATGGYDSSTAIGTIAPGRCSAWMNKCAAGDSSTEPYLVAHHILLCHAVTAKLYREKYKPLQKGQIGIVLVTNWMIPYSKYYVSDLPYSNTVNISHTTNAHVNVSFVRNGKPIGAPTGAGILFVYPKGLTDLLVYIKEKYLNPTIYITENGYAETNINTVEEGIRDTKRIKFYRDHFKALKKAIEKGVDVKGFFAWTFLDTFEWGSGYTMKFGINFVDFKNGLKRYPKLSALWIKQFLLK